MTDLPPIPPDYVRVVVHLGEIVHRMDVPADQITPCLDDFEGNFRLPLRSWRGSVAGMVTVGSIAREAASCGYNMVTGQAVLWLLVYGGQGRALDARRELERLVDQDGGALIKATCSGFSRGWAFEISPTKPFARGAVNNPQPALPVGITLN